MKDGQPNVQIKGLRRFYDFSVYHYMLNLPSFKFFFVILCFYTVINFVFASIYFLIGPQHLQGLITGSFFETFSECYFFSSQTLTTVGYGRVSPVGYITNVVAGLEALIGIMTLAIITGLLYGRFVKPRAFIRFSSEAIIAPFKGGRALMCRLAPTKVDSLSEVEANMTLAMHKLENGVRKNKFYRLPLQLDKIMALSLNWTLVHPIDADSPLFGMQEEDIVNDRMQIVVMVKGFDASFSNTVVTRTSYDWNEIIFNAKYKPMYFDFEADSSTVLDLNEINSYEKLGETITDLPAKI